jgi:hypothetical protein
MISYLKSLQTELEEAAKDKTLPSKRRELALALLDEIDASQIEGFVPENRAADAWLEADVMPLRTQTDIWTYATLNAKWVERRPKYSWGLVNVTPKSSQACSVPESIVKLPQTDTDDFTFGEE